MVDAQAIGTSVPTRFRSNDERWAAVVNRDGAAAGEFVYSVTTTGIYCRPGCPARRPRREHVRFHASCKDAENAASDRAGVACRTSRPLRNGTRGRWRLRVASSRRPRECLTSTRSRRRPA